MKNLKTYFWIAFILISLVLIKIFFFKSNVPQTNAQKPGAPAKPVNVTVMVLQSQAMDNNIFVAGTILSNESVDLQPETSGKVIGIYFTEGQRVSKGQLLVKLNDAELLAQVRKTEAQIRIALEKEARLKKLLDINGVSREEYDAALNQRQSLQADIEVLQAKIAQTEIKAPFSGTIGLKNISIGSIISPTTKIAGLEQLDQAKLDLSIPEKYADIVKNGDNVTFSIEGLPNSFTGHVYAVDPRLDPETRSLKLRAICANPGGLLHAGAFAKIQLRLKTNPIALLVPTQAIVPDMKGQKVFICLNGLSQPKPVQIGLRTEEQVEVVEGLKAGDSVILSGLLQIKPGGRVKVIPSSK